MMLNLMLVALLATTVAADTIRGLVRGQQKKIDWCHVNMLSLPPTAVESHMKNHPYDYPATEGECIPPRSTALYDEGCLCFRASDAPDWATLLAADGGYCSVVKYTDSDHVYHEIFGSRSGADGRYETIYFVWKDYPNNLDDNCYAHHYIWTYKGAVGEWFYDFNRGAYSENEDNSCLDEWNGMAATAINAGCIDRI